MKWLVFTIVHLAQTTLLFASDESRAQTPHQFPILPTFAPVILTDPDILNSQQTPGLRNWCVGKTNPIQI